MTDETRGYCSCGVSIRKGTIFCCMCEPIKKQEWQTTFLNAGTEKGFGDLSMMIGAVSGIIDQALTAHTERIVGEIKKLSDEKTHVSNEDYLKYEEAIDDVLNLIQSNK